MFWGIILLILCVLAFLRNKRAAISFAIPLILAMAITIANPPYVQAWFFAIYACAGVSAFLFLDWKLGLLLCIVSLASLAHVLGYIDAVHRDIAGEALFALCLFAGTIFKPSGGITGRDISAGAGGGYRDRHSDTSSA